MVRLVTSQQELRLDSAEPAPIARWRVDVATVRRVETTPVGGRRVEAGMVRRGQVLEYQRADGTVVRELVSPEAAAASVKGAVVTVGHPASGMVTPETFRRDTVGVVIEDTRFDGDLATSTFDVNDADAVRRLDARELLEVSLGYRAMVVERSGVTEGGVRYDAIQVGRVVNHAALLPRGGARAGREAALRLDGAAVQVDETRSAPPASGGMDAASVPRSDTMETERIDGIDYKVGSPEWRQAKTREAERLASERARLDARVKELETAVATQTARADAAEKRAKDLEAELAPERLDARVATRAALVTKVQPVVGAEVKLDGKSELELMTLALAKLAPDFKLDAVPEAQREVYVRARFDAEMRHVKSAPSPLERARQDALPTIPTPTTAPGAATPDLSAYLVRPGDV